MIIRIDDMRALGHCATGIKRWFDQHDLDFRDFIRRGIAEEVLSAFNDPLTDRVIEQKKLREHGKV